MAILDAAAEQVVIRLVYDGPPRSGKTTSLRALAATLSRRVVTPEESEGRTLLFDWMDYVGGRFEGYDVRCQVVTVPGQAELAGRRRRLLAEADAVIFVADSTREGLDASLGLLAALRSDLAQRPGPPAGLVLQANKRDLPDAVPLDELRDRLGGDGSPVFESVASAGESIRHAFVFAVRLALDRVQALLQKGELASGPPRIDSAGALMLALLEAEKREGTPSEDGIAALREVVARAPAAPAGRPAPPDSLVPGGLIWPPVEGRALVHEAHGAGIDLARLPDGGWISRPPAGRWTVQSSGGAVYDDLERGRGDLLAWALLHQRHQDLLSPARALALAECGDGTWRLWQVVRRERSLADLLAEALGGGPSEEVANRLAAASRVLARAAETFPPGLAVSLRTVGLVARQAVLVGAMPAALAGGAPAADFHSLLASELAALLPGLRLGPGIDLGIVLLRLGRLGDRGQLSEPVLKLLAEALIRHL